MHTKLDLNLLRILTQLLQTKSVTATARRIGSSQPSVSRALAQLRTAFDDPLLIRTSSGMELTERAEQLIVPLQHWLAATNELLMPPEFDPFALSRRFRVASTDFGVSSVIAPALPDIVRNAPSAKIEVVNLSDDIPSRLAAGQLDMAVTGIAPDPALVHSRRLFRETFACVMRADHPLARESADEQVTVDGYLDWPHVTLSVGDNGFDKINTQLGELAERRRIAISLPYFQAAPELLASCDALLTLPQRLAVRLGAQHDLAVREAPGVLGGFDYWLLWHERSHRDPATHWLLDTLAAHCADE